MALQDLMALNASHQKVGISEERLKAVIPDLRKYIAFWREYPDLFVDFLQTGGRSDIDPPFKFFAYQRIFMRAAMRHKYVYGVFARGFSKSFLTIMILMCRCILYPGASLFVTSGGKQQSATIVSEKVQDICNKIPAFDRELDRRRGHNATQEGKDYVRYVFRNGSSFDNVAASERSRGLRRHGGVVEECVGVDGKVLQEVIMPTMAVSRRALDGTKQKEETLNKSTIFITTAGYKKTFSYDKLIQFLVWAATDPSKAIVLGGTWRIPVVAGLQEKTFIQDMERDGTFNELSFQREYESRWSGNSENSFFNGDMFDRNRILQLAEYEANGRNGSGPYYVLSMDVGRKGCASVITVIKAVPQMSAPTQLNLVNIYTLDDEHFEDQCVKLKELYYKYRAQRIVIDGNGLGIGLVDYLVKPQYIPDKNIDLPDFGIYNDDEGTYKKFHTDRTEQNAVYIMKANAPINTTAHANLQSQLSSGHLKLLIDEKLAKNRLMGTRRGQAMTPEQRAEYLQPYTLTSILREELLNLQEETQGINIILKQTNKAIPKDKFSALEYGLYYIREEEENNKKHKKINIKEWKFFN